jgi:hypothetical protein
MLVIIISLYLFLYLIKFFLLKFEYRSAKDNIPCVGETIIVTKEFYWNGSFLKRPEHGPGSKPWYETVNINTNLILDDVIKLDGDFRLKLKRSENDFLYLDYSKTKKYWISKSDLRSKKLKKIGICI